MSWFSVKPPRSSRNAMIHNDSELGLNLWFSNESEDRTDCNTWTKLTVVQCCIFFTNLGQSSAALCKFSLHQMSCAPFCETVPGSVVHRRFLPVYSLAMSHFLGLLGPHFRSAPIFTWCLDPCKNGGESVLFSPKSNSFISRGGGGLAKYVESMANSWLGLSIARRRRDAVRARVVFQKAEFIPFIRNFPAGAFLNVLFCPYDFITQWV